MYSHRTLTPHTIIRVWRPMMATLALLSVAASADAFVCNKLASATGFDQRGGTCSDCKIRFAFTSNDSAASSNATWQAWIYDARAYAFLGGTCDNAGQMEVTSPPQFVGEARGTFNATTMSISWSGSATGPATWFNPHKQQLPLPDVSLPMTPPATLPTTPREDKPCADRITRIFHGDVCGGTVSAPGCAKYECCKSAGLGAHCFCDTCD